MLGLVEAADELVRPRMLPLHIEAAAEDAAGFQDPEGLPVGGLLVREGVEAVQGEDGVKAPVREGESPHIPLLKTDVGKAQALRLLPGLGHHVRGVVETGDLRLGEGLVEGHGVPTGTSRSLPEKPSGMPERASSR